MKKIYYIVNYPCFEKEHYRFANRAAALQSEYLAQVLAEVGYDVTLVSTGVQNERNKLLHLDKGFVKNLYRNVKVIYFPFIDSRYAIIRILGRLLYDLSVKSYIRKHDGIYIVYHTIMHYKINKWIKYYNKKFVLEVEEIYADVRQNPTARVKEIEEISRADAYIIPNRMMCPEITRDKRWILYHGTCKKEPRMGKILRDGKIHIVYAGTMDPMKIGLMPSLDVAMYLNDDYHIHVLAVGYPENQKKIKERISRMNQPHCEITFHDPLDGDDYLQFLQNCDIGLYTQNNNDIDINTSFPSKLMSYLSNGLRIVATRTTPLELSEIADMIYFADSNSGEDMAKTIKSIDFSDGYDGRKKLDTIHKRLKADLAELLKGYEM